MGGKNKDGEIDAKFKCRAGAEEEMESERKQDREQERVELGC